MKNTDRTRRFVTNISKLKRAIRAGILERHYPSFEDSIGDSIAVIELTAPSDSHFVGLNETTLVNKDVLSGPEIKLSGRGAQDELAIAWGECLVAGVKLHNSPQYIQLAEGELDAEVSNVKNASLGASPDFTDRHWQIIGGWNNLTSVIKHQTDPNRFQMMLKSPWNLAIENVPIDAQSIRVDQLLSLCCAASERWFLIPTGKRPKQKTAGIDLVDVLVIIIDYISDLSLSELLGLRFEILDNIGIDLKKSGLSKESLSPLRNLALQLKGSQERAEEVPGLLLALSNWLQNYDPRGDADFAYSSNHIVTDKSEWVSSNLSWNLIGAFLYGFIAGKAGIYGKRNRARALYEYSATKRWTTKFNAIRS